MIEESAPERKPLTTSAKLKSGNVISGSNVASGLAPSRQTQQTPKAKHTRTGSHPQELAACICAHRLPACSFHRVPIRAEKSPTGVTQELLTFATNCTSCSFLHSKTASLCSFHCVSRLIFFAMALQIRATRSQELANEELYSSFQRRLDMQRQTVRSAKYTFISHS